MGWELGGGLGHLMRLRPIAKALLETGHRVVLAARHRSAQSGVRRSAHRAFRSRYRARAGGQGRARRPGRAHRTTHTLADVLARQGFDDPKALIAAAERWHLLLTENQARPRDLRLQPDARPGGARPGAAGGRSATASACRRMWARCRPPCRGSRRRPRRAQATRPGCCKPSSASPRPTGLPAHRAPREPVPGRCNLRLHAPRTRPLSPVPPTARFISLTTSAT